MATRIWTKEEITNLLLSNDKMVVRSLIKIYELQTDDEQADGCTSHSNGVGFNGVDAPILTSFAQFYLSHNFLTGKQLSLARKKLVKYSGQLTRIANEQG